MIKGCKRKSTLAYKRKRRFDVFEIEAGVVVADSITLLLDRRSGVRIDAFVLGYESGLLQLVKRGRQMAVFGQTKRFGDSTCVVAPGMSREMAPACSRAPSMIPVGLHVRKTSLSPLQDLVYSTMFAEK